MADRCVWMVENADECVWTPSCNGDLFIFNAGGPRENRFTFCPYCGGKMVAAIEHVDHGYDLECPCCGDVGAEPTKDGYIDGQVLTCGCPGHVCVEEDGEAWINNGDEACLTCCPQQQKEAGRG